MRLLEKTESVSEALTLSEPALREILGEARAKKVGAQLSGARADEAAKKLEDFQKRGIFFLPLWDDDYPKRLRQIPDPPAALYGIGRVPDDPGKKRAHKAPDRAGECGKAAAVAICHRHIAKSRLSNPDGTAIETSGRDGWIRTSECRRQRPMPYRLATPLYRWAELSCTLSITRCGKAARHRA